MEVRIMQSSVLKFNRAQREVLNVVSTLQSEEDLKDLRRVLVKFMNERLQRETERLWESGEWSQEKLDKMAREHLRTPYK